MATDMPRYVFDANVIVSAALLPTSVPRRALDRACVEGTILLSQPMLTELDDVLRRPKLNRYVTEYDRIQFLVALVHQGELVAVSKTITDCVDPKDNMYLELAVGGAATRIVSGDAHLLSLHPYDGIPVMLPRAFIDQFTES
jgi:putative PIN family toxin of toxin-antitoxin system